MYPTNDPVHKGRRRKLRQDQTMAEKVLWRELKAAKTGHKWRRQFGIGFFIVDFCCVRLKLVIELDGPIHDRQKEYDHKREIQLINKGFKVIRFKNDEILFDRETAMGRLIKFCQARERELGL